jgi:hypothetical protein
MDEALTLYSNQDMANMLRSIILTEAADRRFRDALRALGISDCCPLCDHPTWRASLMWMPLGEDGDYKTSFWWRTCDRCGYALFFRDTNWPATSDWPPTAASPESAPQSALPPEESSA